MKKIYLSLITATMLAGCSSTPDQTTSTQTQAVPAITSTQDLIKDSQFTEFRSNNGKSDYWVKHANKNAGLGDVGSSKDTAFGDDGSARLRFVSPNDDFTAQPGLTQQISGLKPNTDYTLSFYYYDNKGINSPSKLMLGLKDSSGKDIASKTIHVSDVMNNPQGEVKKGFKLVTLDFNSGSNNTAELFALLKIIDPDQINKDGDIGKQTEVRIDEFKITQH